VSSATEEQDTRVVTVKNLIEQLSECQPDAQVSLRVNGAEAPLSDVLGNYHVVLAAWTELTL
jgi:hypothetical protein